MLVYNGGTVCDDYFDQFAADAICSLLGYEGGGSEWASGRSSWDIQSTYLIGLDDVRCRNSSWSSCSYSESQHNCDHSEDVFLTCRSQQTIGTLLMFRKLGYCITLDTVWRSKLLEKQSSIYVYFSLRIPG